MPVDVTCEQCGKHQQVIPARAEIYRLCSVDKPNVLDNGVLWREVVTETGREEFPDVAVSHILSDIGGAIGAPVIP